MSDDALFQWGQSVTSSRSNAGDLVDDIHGILHPLDDLIHTISDLGTVRFYDVEDYEIYEYARGLSSLVAESVPHIQRAIQHVKGDIIDLRRAVEFYNH